MSSRIVLLIVASMLLGAGWTMSGLRLSFFKVERESSAFVLAWQAIEESGVREYEVHRRTNSSAGNEFVRINASPIRAHGVNKAYRFVDDQVFKTGMEMVEYRLEIVFADGTRQVSSAITQNYTSTAIRRTWGSIKAMFQ